MRKWGLAILLWMLIPEGFAANWVKLHEAGGEKLLIDKQSILEVDKHKRAWIKITYNKPQVNEEVAEKTYNLSKLLWFFDCATQKSATAQVFQYSGEELIYSAAVEAKMARFIEPVPETDIDIAMRYVCGIGASAEAPAKEDKSAKENKDNKENKDTAPTEQADANKAKPTEAKSNESKAADTKPNEKTNESKSKESKPLDPKKIELNKAKVSEALTKEGEKSDKLSIKPIVIPGNKSPSKVAWSYDDKTGPDKWGRLAPDYALCEVGKNQSPINIENTIHAVMKPLKMFQRFPASGLINTGHALQINFNQGNILALDGTIYSLKQISFHSPSEHSIKGKSYPLEAQFFHEDPKGKVAMIAVLYEEGKANDVLTNLWKQVPLETGTIKPLKGRILAKDFMPMATNYYRYSGSSTTPPCTEGIPWIVMKAPLSVSKAQVEAFKNTMRQENNRPLQELNGRMVLE